ncbi:MAG TPA: response regulator [Azospirillaceae bacterium]|nr:response regulator [Azospirillaceae bacterium]
MAKRVLTVDDSRTIREMVAFTLRGAGYEVAEASDGPSGLNLLKTTKFDCIISDINMPGMDGIAFTKAVRATPNHRSAPVLLLTTESDPEKKTLGKQAGATGWLTKPFNPDKLIETVRKVCP